MEQTVKKKFGIRDIMTIAAMMVINFAIAMIIGMVTLPFPVVYLYGSAGIDAFIGAIFFIWLQQTASTNTDCCLHGLRFMGGDSRSYGLYVLDSLFLDCSSRCRTVHGWQEYIPKCGS